MADFEHQDTTSWNPDEVRQSDAPPRRERRRRRRRMKWYYPVIYLFVVLLISVILASIGWARSLPTPWK